jgi:hypothetical protein
VAKPKKDNQAETKTIVAPNGNRNIRARITYKGGVTQDLLIVANYSNYFEVVMRPDFLKFLKGVGPAFGTYGQSTPQHEFSIVVLWSEVVSFHEWID